MGADSLTAPPLPAPTETTESIADPSEVSEVPSDASHANEERSTFSLPDDGTPVTIRTRGGAGAGAGPGGTHDHHQHHHHRSQTSLLIEYFETSKPGPSGSATGRQSDVRVRLVPSKRGRRDHGSGGATDTKSTGSRKTSVSRRKPSGAAASSSGSAAGAAGAAAPTSSRAAALDEPDYLDHDARSMNSYASATEESTVSRRGDPLDMDLDHHPSRHAGRPPSPLVPTAVESMTSFKSGAGNGSEISDIPTDSFLDGYDGRRSDVLDDPLIPAALSLAGTGAAAAAASTILADHSTKVRSESRDTSRAPRDSRDARDRDRDRDRDKDRDRDRDRDRDKDARDRSENRHRSSASKSRTRVSSGDVKSSESRHRRRSSRGHQESAVSAVESGRSYDQHSTVSAASRSSINNPRLLETVEDAIRRLILPELSALKREQSKRDSNRRGSITSIGTSASREDLSAGDRRKSSSASDRRGGLAGGGGGGGGKEDAKKKDRRDREARHAYGDSSPLGLERDSPAEPAPDHPDTPGRSSDKLKAAAAAGAALGTAAAPAEKSLAEDRRQRRRRRADHHRSRSAGGGGAADSLVDEYGPDDHSYLSPPMPLMSEINPSEVTRTSLLSIDSDRPHSAAEEQDQAHEAMPGGGAGGAASGASTPTQSRASPLALGFPHNLGMKHANISHGDLTTLARRRTGEYEGAAKREQEEAMAREYLGLDDDDEQQQQHQQGQQLQDEYQDPEDDDNELDFGASAYPYPPGPYAYQQHVLSPIPSEAEGGSEASGAHSASVSPSPAYQSQAATTSHVLGHAGRAFDDPYAVESDANYGAAQRSTFTEASEGGQKAVNTIAANPNVVSVPFGIESAVASLIDGSVMTDSQVNQPQSRSRSTPYGGEDDGFAEEYEPNEYGQKERRYHHEPVSPLASSSQRSPTESEAAITAGAVAALVAKSKKAQGGEEGPSARPGAGAVGRNLSFNAHRPETLHTARTPTMSIDRFDDTDSGAHRHPDEEHIPKMGISGIPDWNDPLPEAEYIRHSYAESYDEDDTGSRHPADDQERDPRDPRDPGDPEMDLDLDLDDDEEHDDGRRTPTQRDTEWHRTSEERKRDTLITNPYEDASPVANPALNDGLIAQRAFGNYSPGGGGFGTGSPGLQARAGDGFVSPESPLRTPEPRRNGQMTEPGDDPFTGGNAAEGAFPLHNHHHSTNNNAHHRASPTGLSQGRQTPMYDGATGLGMDGIESQDIIGLMQFLMARDAKKDAHEGALVQALIQTAVEMQNSFSDLRRLLAQTRDEINDNTDQTVNRAINGPRPYPGGVVPRSAQVGGASNSSGRGTQEEINLKKQSIFRRALRGLGNKGTNDLSRIEDMLNHLLTEVDVLKSQTAVRPGPPSSMLPPSSARPSLDQGHQQQQPQPQQQQFQPFDGEAPLTPSAEPEGGYANINGGRRVSDNRISTVPEEGDEDANEDDGYTPDGRRRRQRRHRDQHHHPYSPGAAFVDPALMRNSPAMHKRSDSIPLDSPVMMMEAAAGGSSPVATTMMQQQYHHHHQPPHRSQQPPSGLADTTPRTDRSRKSKSSGWFPKISRWSETTTSSVGRVFRSSANSSGARRDRYGDRDRDNDYMQRPPQSRSGSLLGEYDDVDDGGDEHGRGGAGGVIDAYGEDRLHTGFSASDLAPNLVVAAVTPEPLHLQNAVAPEDPKYKAHRNSINLQHPQPRPGQTERFRHALEFSAQEFVPGSPRSADWNNSVTSISRLPPNQNARYTGGGNTSNEVSSTTAPDSSPNWRTASPAAAAAAAPPRPPKEPLPDDSDPVSPSSSSMMMRTPPRPGRVAQLQKNSPLLGTDVNYTSSSSAATRYENRTLSNAASRGTPARRPSGPRAMTPKNSSSNGPDEDASLAREERRRKRDTFGSIAAHDSEGS